MWRIATLTAPVTVQAAFGVLLLSAWLIGKLLPPTDQEAARLLAALGSMGVLNAGVGGVLLTRRSPTPRGWGVSVLGTAATVLIGGAAYVGWAY